MNTHDVRFVQFKVQSDTDEIHIEISGLYLNGIAGLSREVGKRSTKEYSCQPVKYPKTA